MNHEERELIERIIGLLRQLEAVGRDMKPLMQFNPRWRKKARLRKHTEKLQECGELMRYCRIEAGGLLALIEGLPLPEPFDRILGTAANEILACATCARYSMKRCDAASEYLDEAEKLLKKIS